MQPLRLPPSRQPVSSMCLHRRVRHQIAHRLGKTRQAFGASPAHSCDRRGGHLDTDEICHQCVQAVLGQQSTAEQIDHEGRDSGAVLHGRVDAIWKQRARLRAAGGASAIVRTMFGDDERRRLGRSNTCRTRMANARFRVEAMRHIEQAGGYSSTTASGSATCRSARLGGPPARAVPCRNLPASSYPRRLLQLIARRWLAAVRTVQFEPALEFGEPRFQSHISAGSAALSATPGSPLDGLARRFSANDSDSVTRNCCCCPEKSIANSNFGRR